MLNEQAKTESKERDISLDIAKGIAIIFVVCGHCWSTKSVINTIVYGFHMPFFFVMTGLLYGKTRKAIPIKKQIANYLVPYFNFEIIYAAYISFLGHHDVFFNSFIGLMRPIVKFRGVSTPWFLPCALLTQILFVLLQKLKIKSDRLNQFALLIMMVVGMFAPMKSELAVLYRSFVGLGFFGIGYYFSGFLLKRISLKLESVLFLIYIVLAYVNGWCIGKVDLCSLTFANPVLYIVNGSLGSYIIIQLSMRIADKLTLQSLKSIVAMFGANSIVVLCTHMFVVEAFRIIDAKVFGNLFPKFGFIEGVVFGTVVVCIEAAIIPIMNKHFYYMFGRKRKGRE